MNCTNLYIATVRNLLSTASAGDIARWALAVDETPLTLSEALDRIEVLNPVRYEMLECEYARPDYYIIDEQTLSLINARHDDNSQYGWDDYDGELDADGNPVDETRAATWMIEQDVDLIREEALELHYGVGRRAAGHSHASVSPSTICRTKREAIEELIRIVNSDLESDVANLPTPEDLVDDGDAYSAWFGDQLQRAEDAVRDRMSHDDGNGVTWSAEAWLEPRVNGRSYKIDVDDLEIVREI